MASPFHAVALYRGEESLRGAMAARIPSFDLYDEIAPESVAHNPFIDSRLGRQRFIMLVASCHALFCFV